jgi:hypothetical protein
MTPVMEDGKTVTFISGYNNTTLHESGVRYVWVVGLTFGLSYDENKDFTGIVCGPVGV